MTTDVPLVLWLFVVNLGLVFGAGVYEQRIVAPQMAGPPERGAGAMARRVGARG